MPHIDIVTTKVDLSSFGGIRGVYRSSVTVTLLRSSGGGGKWRSGFA
jgi:hypothetical protein